MTKKVVVLGAGYGGTAVAGGLDKIVKTEDLELTVIDKRDAMIHKLGGLRAATDTTWADKVIVPRDKLLKNGKFMTGEVASLTDHSVTLKDGTSLDFDFCVIATGALNASPGEPSANAHSMQDLKAYYAKSHEAFENATKIAIIGGGVVGVELSGEIKNKFPSKDITIIHSGDTLISGSSPPLPASFHRRLNKQMDKLGIKRVMGARAEIDMSEFQGQVLLPGERTIHTTTGDDVVADLTILCVGTVPNTGGFPSTWLNSKSLVKVNNKLQVLNGDEALPNVYALGDVCDVAENKMAYYTGLMAPIVLKNLIASIQGKKVIKSYKAHNTPFMVVPLGPKGGAMATPLGAFGATFASMVKGKSLFLNLAWPPNNLKTPSA
mmetsp:Transcript_2913/g.4957  ORF Transcript_2913/g.4957 Transcript_2913/m.4957 type:complete len:379 (-) Transcript_2913:26-1162(-)|eukprot:CAMPEP_0171510758 /NCGR_PEP_ID=MMETSP0959-20130129/578_1 /TAXON_ID=87120 /ORGANISM="Aurantiochytrium limacinum, Strain ATCCMYA-1381" /LENGTH=378 /DNA_ID=CAMNT_0012048231 /DNA_START=144 /DNA_END=1280 /DNA_ORIENTATION=-